MPSALQKPLSLKRITLYGIMHQYKRKRGIAMQIQSSYIFLPNPNRKSEKNHNHEDGVIYIETGHSIHSHIIDTFSGVKCERIDDLFFQHQYFLNKLYFH